MLNYVPISALVGLRNRWVAELQLLPPQDRMTHPKAQCVHDLGKNATLSVISIDESTR